MQFTHIGRIDTNPAAVDTLLRRIPSPVAGELVRALAARLDCIESFYESIRRSLEDSLIHKAAEKLRQTAYLFPITALECTSPFHSFQGREEVRQIKYVVEVFYYLEPVFAILAALAERWIAEGFNLELLSEERDDCTSFMPIGFDNFELVGTLNTSHTFYRTLTACSYKIDADNAICNLLIAKARSLSHDITLLPVQHPHGIDKPALEDEITGSLKMSAATLVKTSVLRKVFIANEVADRKMRSECEKLGRAL